MPLLPVSVRRLAPISPYSSSSVSDDDGEGEGDGEADGVESSRAVVHVSRLDPLRDEEAAMLGCKYWRVCLFVTDLILPFSPLTADRIDY